MKVSEPAKRGDSPRRHLLCSLMGKSIVLSWWKSLNFSFRLPQCTTFKKKQKPQEMSFISCLLLPVYFQQNWLFHKLRFPAGRVVEITTRVLSLDLKPPSMVLWLCVKKKKKNGILDFSKINPCLCTKFCFSYIVCCYEDNSNNSDKNRLLCKIFLLSWNFLFQNCLLSFKNINYTYLHMRIMFTLIPFFSDWRNFLSLGTPLAASSKWFLDLW